jgi:hypothetical protein
MEQEVTAGLMKITTAPPIFSNREVLDQQSVAPGMMTTIKAPTFYKHAVIVIHGDGDPQTQIRIVMGATTIILPGDKVNVRTVANASIQIFAVNTDPNTSRTSSRVEILSLDWG